MTNPAAFTTDNDPKPECTRPDSLTNASSRIAWPNWVSLRRNMLCQVDLKSGIKNSNTITMELIITAYKMCKSMVSRKCSLYIRS